MTLRTPPSWLQNGSHTAENDRLTATKSLWYSAGVIDYADLKVTQSATPAMSAQIAIGSAVITGTLSSNQGSYIAYNDATVSVSIATSNPTLPRIDLIVITVQDSYYTGSTDAVIFSAVTGTPNATPVAPSAPANSLILAQIAVGAAVTSITNANITDKRAYATISDIHTTASNVAADSLTITGIASQTGKALKITDSTGTQVFAVSASGGVTFPDGSTQTSASTYNPTLTINAQTVTSYTLVGSDKDKMVTFNNAGNITVTVPSSGTTSFAVGAQINLAQIGAGQVTVVGATTPTSVTVNATPSLKFRSQYSSATLIQLSTDNWILVGDMSS